jgi:hypothetical protein
VPERDEPALLFIPEGKAYASDACEQRDTADVHELCVIAEYFRQAIERNAAL